MRFEGVNIENLGAKLYLKQADGCSKSKNGFRIWSSTNDLEGHDNVNLTGYDIIEI